MTPHIKAWISRLDGLVEGAFVAAGTSHLAARRIFPDEREARGWIEREAAAIGAPLVWYDPPRCSPT
jgi:hypothetical protein